MQKQIERGRRAGLIDGEEISERGSLVLEQVDKAREEIQRRLEIRPSWPIDELLTELDSDIDVLEVAIEDLARRELLATEPAGPEVRDLVGTKFAAISRR